MNLLASDIIFELWCVTQLNPSVLNKDVETVIASFLRPKILMKCDICYKVLSLAYFRTQRSVFNRPCTYFLKVFSPKNSKTSDDPQVQCRTCFRTPLLEGRMGAPR